jgi:hemolysin III
MIDDLPEPVLLDRQRGTAYHRPKLRGVSHLIAFNVSLVLGTLIVTSSHDRLASVAALVYATSVAGLFGVSALYHCGRWRPGTRRWLQRLDHAMIFLMIAGTYTPVLLLVLDGDVARTLLAAVWALTALGMLLHLVRIDAPEWVVGGLYLGLGWMSVPALPVLWDRVGPAGALLVLAGGVLYTVGAIAYYRRWFDLRPHVFGYHEVFHVFVIAAAACHYALIGWIIL